MKRLILAAATMAWAAGSWAGTDYRCKVERIYDADGEDSATIDAERKAFIGKEFTVDRRTGVMAGGLHNAYATEPVVIDHGSQDNAFKAVTTMRIDQGAGAGSAAYMIVVKEYADSARKPFAFIDSDTVYFGGCEHF